MSPRHASNTRTRGTWTIVVVAVVAALIAVPIVAIASTTAKSATSKAIAAMLGAGVMSKQHGSFHPNDAVKREGMALFLQRGLGRIALTSIGGSAAAAGSVELGSVALKIDGAPGKFQAVLLTFHGQLDHDNALTAGCFPSFSVTRGNSPTVIASRSQEEYGGGGGTGLELPVSMSFLVTQQTNHKTNYHLTLTNPCTATLFIDGGDFTAQNFPLSGTGGAVPPPVKQQQKQEIAPHDR